MNCKTCKHWEQLNYEGAKHYRDPDDEFSVLRDPENRIPTALWGRCMKADEFNPARSSRFYCTDGSDYEAWLHTRNDFGCVEHENQA